MGVFGDFVNIDAYWHTGVDRFGCQGVAQIRSDGSHGWGTNSSLLRTLYYGLPVGTKGCSEGEVGEVSSASG